MPFVRTVLSMKVVGELACRSSGETLVCFGLQSCCVVFLRLERRFIFYIYGGWCCGREEVFVARNHIVTFVYLLDIPADDSHRVMEGE